MKAGLAKLLLYFFFYHVDEFPYCSTVQNEINREKWLNLRVTVLRG